MFFSAAFSIFALCQLALGGQLRGQAWDLVEELIPYTTAAFSENLPDLEAALTPMYRSLPKDEQGLLSYDSARYALHRMLVDRHGWYVKGLEPDGKAWNASSLEASLAEWVPERMQHVIEHHFSRGGLSLRELAAVASLLEDTAKDEARNRLVAVYGLHGLATDSVLHGEKAKAVLEAYLYVYLDVHDLSDIPDNLGFLHMMMRSYEEQLPDSWHMVQAWLAELRQNVTQVEDELSFDSALRVAIAVGERYAFFDYKECKKLKRTLLQIESERPGRVLLSSFYRQGMAPDANFKFTEKVDYLRDMGALDESDAKNPAIIMPNYVESKSQCLESSTVYSVCCRSECEDMLQHLERQIADSHARVSEVVRLIEALPSETVRAPRELPPRLLERLQQVAEANDGSIPLHGRLFAQWMHHAFPRECPFPHEAGTISPMSAQDWIRETGQEGTQASEEDMVCYVDGACAGGAASTSSESSEADALRSEGESELPWSDKEELLAGSQTSRQGRKSASPLRSLVQSGLALVVFALAIKSLWLSDDKEKKQASSSIFSFFPQAGVATQASDVSRFL